MSNLNSLKNDNLYCVETFEEKLEFAQRYMTLLGQNIMKLAYKKSKVRDIGDEMAQNLLEFALNDSSNELFRSNLKQLAYCLSSIEDIRDSNVEYINSKILNELRIFNESIKYSRNDLKTMHDSYNRDHSRKKGLFGIFLKASDFDSQMESISIENELAMVKAKDFSDKLKDSIIKFETNKINNIQKILSDYIQNELVFHEKVIKFYMNAYKQINKKEINSKKSSFNVRIVKYKRRSQSESSLSTLNYDKIRHQTTKNFKFISKDLNYSSSSNSNSSLMINKNFDNIYVQKRTKQQQQIKQQITTSEDDSSNCEIKTNRFKSNPDKSNQNVSKPTLKVYNETEL